VSTLNCREPRGRGGTWLIACSASAVMLSDGFTPGFAGIAAPSQMRKFR
jgi:hypothetical protein